SPAKSLLRFDEFNAFYPLHHFIAKLVFNAQSKWSAIDFRQRRLVHLISEHTPRVERRLNGLRVVVFSTVQRLAVGIKCHDSCFWPRFDNLDQPLERKPAPLRDSRPPLDAMVHGDVFFLAERTEFLN